MMDQEEVERGVAVTSGHISGNETVYNYSEDDIVSTENVVGLSTSGW